jgi:hypothetical protein
MNLTLIGSDEQQNEGVFRSLAITAMGADAGSRRGKVVGDPVNDAAALFRFALAQRGDNVPFAASDDRKDARRRWRVSLKSKVVAIEPHANAAIACEFERVVDCHSRALQPGAFFGGTVDVCADCCVLSVLSPCPAPTGVGIFISLSTSSEGGNTP